MASFSDYFNESMRAVHMPVPGSLFETWTTALATCTSLNAMVARFGTKVTLEEVLRTAPDALPAAVYREEVLVATAGLTAAAYAGFCIGAFVYACERSAGLDLLSVSNKVDDICNRARASGIVVPSNLERMIRQQASRRITSSA